MHIKDEEMRNTIIYRSKINHYHLALLRAYLAKRQEELAMIKIREEMYLRMRYPLPLFYYRWKDIIGINLLRYSFVFIFVIKLALFLWTGLDSSFLINLFVSLDLNDLLTVHMNNDLLNPDSSGSNNNNGSGSGGSPGPNPDSNPGGSHPSGPGGSNSVQSQYPPHNPQDLESGIKKLINIKRSNHVELEIYSKAHGVNQINTAEHNAFALKLMPRQMASQAPDKYALLEFKVKGETIDKLCNADNHQPLRATISLIRDLRSP